MEWTLPAPIFIFQLHLEAAQILQYTEDEFLQTLDWTEGKKKAPAIPHPEANQQVDDFDKGRNSAEDGEEGEEDEEEEPSDEESSGDEEEEEEESDHPGAEDEGEDDNGHASPKEDDAAVEQPPNADFKDEDNWTMNTYVVNQKAFVEYFSQICHLCSCQ